MKFSIISNFTGEAISEDRLLDEVDGYDEGDLAELNKIIGSSIKELCGSDKPLISIDLLMITITKSLMEILNYINVLGSISDEILYLGYGDKVIPCGVEVTVDNETCTVDEPHMLYDETLPDFVTSLDLEAKVHDHTLMLITSNCPSLMANAALLCLNDSEIKLPEKVVTHIFNASTFWHLTMFSYIYDTPYTLDPIE